MRRTKEDAAKTRQTLINAGLEIFREKGISAARLEDIARHANVTRGAIYWHFKNKMELHEAIVVECTDRLQCLLNEVLSSKRTHLEKIQTLLTKFFFQVQENQVFYDIYSLTNFHQDELENFKSIHQSILNYFRNTIKSLTSLLQAGQESGEIRDDIEPANLAWGMMILFEGTMSFSHNLKNNPSLNYEIISFRDKAEALVKLFLEGLIHK